MIDATVCVCDLGLFTEIAIRLAREFKTVLYHVPWESEFPIVNDVVIGDGLGTIKRIMDPWDPDVFDQVDLFVFPDVFRSGWQLQMKAMGKPVWGSGRADVLETDRVRFKELQKQLGLPHPEYSVIRGTTDLKHHLEAKEDVFIKADSDIRGSWETLHYHNMITTGAELSRRELKIWGVRDDVRFVVENNLNSEIETGIDSPFIGQWPSKVVQGYEIKGKLILMAVQTYSNLPIEIKSNADAIEPELKKLGCLNNVSLEIKIKHGKGYVIDPCVRFPNPGSGVQMEMISNLGKMMLECSMGVMTEPEYEFQFGIQAAMHHDHESDQWKTITIPEQCRRWVKLMDFCGTKDGFTIIPRVPYGDKIGWVLGMGDTVEQCYDHLMSNVELLKDCPVEVKHDQLAEALKEIDIAEDQGVEFSKKPLPEPEIVLKD